MFVSHEPYRCDQYTRSQTATRHKTNSPVGAGRADVGGTLRAVVDTGDTVFTDSDTQTHDQVQVTT